MHNGTDYQFAFTTLLQLIGSSLNVGVNISFGTTLPQNSSGKNGDVFINTNIGSFAQKIANVWVVVYTLPTSAGTTDGTVLYAMGVPNNITGSNNDTYINTATGIFYKKSAGSWSQVFSMQTGPAGPPGSVGTNGTNGTNGFSVLNGATTPSNLSTGVNGDFYINTTNYILYGPKTAGNWGSGISLIGEGIGIGGNTGEVLAKASNADFDIEWVDLNTTYLKTTGGSLTGDVQQSASPINANSLVTKGYADNLFTGLSWKQEVTAATTTNITLSGTQTIDGIALVANDRVLVKNQTLQTGNGIYLVQNGAWVRTADADTSAEIGTATLLVRKGTINKNTQWTCTNSTDPVLGTDNITFGQISGAGTYTNGAGISLIGNVFGLDLTYADGRYGKLASSLSQFASTTSAQLRSILSDTTGTGNVVFSASPIFTGTISAGTITTNGTITGPNVFITAAAGNNPEVRLTPVTSGSSVLSLLNVGGSSPLIAYQDVLRIATVSAGAGSGAVNTMTCDVSNNVNVVNSLTVGIAATVAGLTTTNQLSLIGNISAANWSTNGLRLTISNATMTNTSSLAGATIATMYGSSLGNITLAHTNTGVTVTTFGVLNIGTVTAGTNTTIGTIYGLTSAHGINVGGSRSDLNISGDVYTGNLHPNIIVSFPPALPGGASVTGIIATNNSGAGWIGATAVQTKAFLGYYTNGDNITASQYKLSALNSTPTSSTDTGVLGEIRVTATAIYICTATNTWVKTSLITF